MLVLMKNDSNENNLCMNTKDESYRSFCQADLSSHIEPILGSDYQYFYSLIKTLNDQKKNKKQVFEEECKKNSKLNFELGIEDIDSKFAGFYHVINGVRNILIPLNQIRIETDILYRLPNKIDKKDPRIMNIYQAYKQVYNGKKIRPCVYVYYSTNLYTFFEALLTNTQILLDRMTGLIYEQFNITSPYNYFGNFFNQVSGNTDPTIADLRNTLDPIRYELENIVYPNGVQKTLRNRIVHEASTLELSDNIFSIYWFADDNIVRFDSDILDGYPSLMNCVFKIYKCVPEIAISVLSKIINYKFNTSIKDDFKFELKWENILIDYRDYIVDTEDPNGIMINTFKIDELVIEFKKMLKVDPRLFENN